MKERRFVEIVDPFDRLSSGERRTLDAAFERVSGPDGRDVFVLRAGASDRAVTRANAIINRHHLMGKLGLPDPPAPGDWRVWHYRRSLWKYEALAAPDSLVRRALHGSTRESRRQLAMRAVQRVDSFRRRCSRHRKAWWFEICNRVMND